MGLECSKWRQQQLDKQKSSFIPSYLPVYTVCKVACFEYIFFGDNLLTTLLRGLHVSQLDGGLSEQAPFPSKITKINN